MRELYVALWDQLVACYQRLRKTAIEPLSQAPAAPRSIIVFSTTSLGDLLLNTPSIRALRHSFPEAALTLVVHPKMYPFVAGYTRVDHIETWRNKYRDLPAALVKLRRLTPDWVVMLHSNGPQDIHLAALSGASIILKESDDPHVHRWTSCKVASQDMHAIRKRLEMVSRLGCDSEDARLEIPNPKSARGYGLKDSSARLIVGFQAGASEPYKRWPTAKFAELANRLLGYSPSLEIVLTGTREEATLADAIMAKLVDKDRVHNFCGRCTLQELPGLIQEMDVLVTGDTGPLHVAIAQQVSTVSLFSATNPKWTGPIQDIALHRVIKKPGENVQAHLRRKLRDETVMEIIQVAEVYHAAIELLEQKRSQVSAGSLFYEDVRKGPAA